MDDLGPLVEIIESHLEDPRPSGTNNVTASCPFPDHSDRGPSFAINTLNGLWMCHGCKRSGTFVSLLRALGYNRRAVTSLTESVQGQLDHYEKKRKWEAKTRFRRTNPLKSKIVLPETLLGVYDWKPLDLVAVGFDPSLLKELDIGYDRVKNRITYPIRDTLGNLVGISGRATEEWDKPKYKVYTGASRDSDGKIIEGDFGEEFEEWFKKDQRKKPGRDRVDRYSVDSHNHLWNGHRVYARLVMNNVREPLYIVEGYKACIWLIQHGYPNTVALMGSYMTKKQFDLLCLLAGGTMVLLLDNDPPGRQATRQIGERLFKARRKVHVCSYFPWWAEEPDDLNGLGVTRTIETGKVYVAWRLQMEERHAAQAEA